jgi:Domain of unknown function (DUF4198)
MNRIHRLIVGLALAGSASAHDTWFESLPNGGLALGTGNRFPVNEIAVDDKFFVKSGCVSADGKARSLDKLRFTDKATLLRSKGRAGNEPLTCFVQLQPFDLDLPADKIEIYFKEIRPSNAALAAWADLKARGLPFKERYTKSARIDIGADASSQPTGTAMDALRVSPRGALTVGSEVVFQVLRDGKPLPDFPVELINERSPLGLWHRTDAEGRIRAKLPLPGRWLLRGTELQLSATDATRWESQFITYAFEVGRGSN